MIKTAREYLGSGVCAADLAGAEALYPMSEFMDIFTNNVFIFYVILLLFACFFLYVLCIFVLLC